VATAQGNFARKGKSMKPKPIRTFSIIPQLPEALEPLRKLAYNLRWTWKHDIIELFLRMDSELWENTNHNPVLMLGTIAQKRLDELAHDEGFVAHLHRVSTSIDSYMQDTDNTWFARNYETTTEPQIAYFSLEFGITECLGIFAGGLGILAGDHLKSASDLGLPLVGVGLLYQQGYFRQYLNQAGWQQEAYENNHFDNLPLELKRKEDGSPLIVEVDLPGREVGANIWQVQVGRIKLYLLDTNIPQNTRAEDRDITDKLYGEGQDLRIRQEILLGIGGYKALKALGITPTVYHMNEGHSAFLGLQHISFLMHKYNLTFQQAREVASTSLVFTTHTPVSAGHDRFSDALMRQYFTDYVSSDISISWDEFMNLGRENPADPNEPFCMTVLAIRLSAHTNGVSKLHGEVTREMWQGLWPGVPTQEIPISHVTNGIHALSWISRDMEVLYDRYLGPRWREEPGDKNVWERARTIAPDELWRTHERRRERLVNFARLRLRQQLEQHGAPQQEIIAADEVLDPEALTIGFARRFATYKRATLFMYDTERLSRILNNPEYPVQFIFAGLAHPSDNPGKSLIQQIVRLSREDNFRNRLVFLENYDMNIARYLTQGVDIWLNNPRRPREASGTSGMKAAANGILNLSVLDGWWDEAYKPEVGWAIGRGEVYTDPNYQDQVEAEALYNLLEHDIVPMFYDRTGRLPRRWINYMKECIGALCYYFNTNRMVAEYTTRFYVPAFEHFINLTADDVARGKELAAFRGCVTDNWNQLYVKSVNGHLPNQLHVGEKFSAQANIFLGELTPENVHVELYVGLVNTTGEIVQGRAIPMQLTETEENGLFLYSAESECAMSGLHGYTVRILPHHTDLTTQFVPGLIKWAG
jgi:starch phosphorylase